VPTKNAIAIYMSGCAGAISIMTSACSCCGKRCTEAISAAGEKLARRYALCTSRKNWQTISGYGGRNPSIPALMTSSFRIGSADSSIRRITGMKMWKLGDELGLPKLTFQVIRRTIATLAQKKGAPKDIKGVLRHSRLSTTDVYMQEIPESVKETVGAINKEKN
jgi:integrase